jgi:hypothetical protein
MEGRPPCRPAKPGGRDGGRLSIFPGGAQKSLRGGGGCVRTFFAVQYIFKPARNEQNLNRQQNGGRQFDRLLFCCHFCAPVLRQEP